MDEKKIYIVYNWHELYNIFLSKERALKAMDILAQRQGIKRSKIDKNVRKGFSSIIGLEEGLYLFEVEEGEAFGHNLNSEKSRWLQNV